MSRSRNKNPIFGHTTCKSEKQDKKLWHRRFRRNRKQDIENTDIRYHSNPWSMGKDGKQYYRNFKEEDLRK